ncbi:MAG: efflux RND transporter periplasmic adaptor subunit [Bacteroidales bacterium]|nr:efflux RND transporter periplasmic adaptor subunit [Bacteroidales bacterium]
MKKIFKILMWVLVAAVFVGTFVYLYINSRPKEVRYNIVEPEVATIERSTVLTGKIEPRDEIEIKPQISGIISELCVEAGDFVRKDDIIAKIKVIPEESSLNSAQNRVDVAQLSLDLAKSQYERTKGLYDKKFVSREEYEQSYTEWMKAQQEMDAAIDALSIVRDGISTANAQQSNTLVRATIDGQILDVPVKVGSSVIQSNTFNDGTSVAKMANMRDLIFEGKVDETEVGMLRPGMETVISIGALPDISHHAVIEFIAPKSTEENGSNTFQIKAAIEVNDTLELRAGYSANASVVLQSAKDVLTVPEATVEWSGDSTFVYVLTKEQPQEFERIPFAAGMSDGLKIEVKSGIPSDAKLRGLKIED